MNKRRRFKAKRRRIINQLRDQYNRPWAYGHDGQMFVLRREAGKRLRAMGDPEAPSWP